jgi:hypothetical protein
MGMIGVLMKKKDEEGYGVQWWGEVFDGVVIVAVCGGVDDGVG